MSRTRPLYEELREWRAWHDRVARGEEQEVLATHVVGDDAGACAMGSNQPRSGLYPMARDSSSSEDSSGSDGVLDDVPFSRAEDALILSLLAKYMLDEQPLDWNALAEELPTPRTGEEIYRRHLALVTSLSPPPSSAPPSGWVDREIGWNEEDESEEGEYEAESREKILRACAQRQLDAANDYAFGLLGDGMMERAMSLYRAAAHSGLVEAQLLLADCYYHGLEGFPEDCKKAVKWYRKAADQGSAKAQCYLGDCYRHGEGVELDIVEALRLYRLSAAQNFACAQNRLGFCYEWGKGVDKDFEQAFRWYKLAADNGYRNSKYSLALCYKEGKGVAVQNFFEAARLFQQAADEGEFRSFRELGLLYLEGRGVQRSCDIALHWLRLFLTNHLTDHDDYADDVEKVDAAIIGIESTARTLIHSTAEMQRTLIEAGESVFGHSQDTGDFALHVAARQMHVDTVALYFDHPSFDDLLLRANNLGKLPRDLVGKEEPSKKRTHKALALRSILSVPRRTRAACVQWCFDVLRQTASNRLLACIPQDIIGIIVRFVGPPAPPGSLQCNATTLMNSPLAWPRPCLATVPSLFPQPASGQSALVTAVQQQTSQVVARSLPRPKRHTRQGASPKRALPKHGGDNRRKRAAPPAISSDGATERQSKRSRR